MQASVDAVERAVTRGEVTYGINTGFGAFANKVIPAAQTRKLQLNLIRSHACGSGAPLPAKIVRRMLLLKANSLAAGHSGVRPRRRRDAARAPERGRAAGHPRAGLGRRFGRPRAARAPGAGADRRRRSHPRRRDAGQHCRPARDRSRGARAGGQGGACAPERHAAVARTGGSRGCSRRSGCWRRPSSQEL